MTRKALLAVTLGTLLAGSVGCHRNTRERAEDTAEDAADKVEDTAEKAGDKAEDAAEKAGDKIEDATDK
ncbi:YtxH domain-containing protein [Cystobacter fuscus]|uniref:YtxH domain-containing protein n=1 Tax=Cystobacter fuscus TaxID=43 RepID=UPI002B2801FD|nr:YtxH domain-containing protein [Cystobacter fuscus]WNG29432.1 YtxH domain-containing protein [Cystobacter fuscus]